MATHSKRRQILTGLLAVLVVLTLFSGVAAAQSGVSGTLTVESGETVSSVSGLYGTIIIEGTVTGDVSGVAGEIVIRDGGVVEGDLDAAAGSIQISGTVEGTVSAGAGSVQVTETGVVDGNFNVGAATVRIDGTVQGDARIGADTIRLGEQAVIAGSLTYDGTLEGNLDAVSGEITRDRSLGPSVFSGLQPFASWVFAINAFLLNFLLGALLIGLFPRFSDGVADTVSNDPIRTGLLGIGVLVAVPLLLVAVAITVVGIPLSIAGLLAFMLVAWVGLVYGRFAVGCWLLSFTDVDNRWVALLVGLLLAVLLWQLPYIGALLNAIIFLLGLGALVSGLYTHRRRVARQETTTAESTQTD